MRFSLISLEYGKILYKTIIFWHRSRQFSTLKIGPNTPWHLCIVCNLAIIGP